MEEVVEEKKPFDHEIIKDEEDTQPEPDEVLGMNGLPGKVWAVKVRNLSYINLSKTFIRVLNVYEDPEACNGTVEDCYPT